MLIKRRTTEVFDDENLIFESNLINFYHENLEDTSYDEKMIKDLFDNKRIHISINGERETRSNKQVENDESY